MAKRRCRKSKEKVETKQETESFFEVVDVKDLLESQQTVEVLESGISNATTRKPKRNIVRSKRVGSTQVCPEDIDGVAVQPTIPFVSGQNEPIPFDDGETTVPQCRLCLRRVSLTNLRVILSKHKPKAMTAFKLKIFPSDAYPLACCNCLNLLDILLDFQDTVLKARNLLLSKRCYLKSNGWDDPSVVDAFAKCRVAVEEHKKEIDLIFEEHCGISETPKIETDEVNRVSETTDDSVKPDVQKQPDLMKSSASGEMVIEPLFVGDFIIKQSPEHAIQEDKVDHNKDESDHDKDEDDNDKDEDDNDKDECDYDKDEDDHDEDEGDNDKDDVDFVPSSFKESEIKKTPAKRKRGTINKRKEKKQRAPKIKKKKKQQKLTKEQRQKYEYTELCDLCGERIGPRTAEGHKNRHLGIKPYKCPALDCKLTFYSRENSAKHVRRMHTDNGIKVVQCSTCGTSVRGGLWALRIHQRCHEMLEKNFICPICGKGFARDRYLKQHSMVHSEEFPHKCSYCGKKFYLWNNELKKQ